MTIDLPARLADRLRRPLAADARLAVAVSGGPDSLALLLMAARAWPGRVTALTVDHGLRPDSAAEAAGVAELCARLGTPHVTLRWDGAGAGSSLQAAARAARYRLMADWCRSAGVTLLLTAHHADDQAETLLMRLARGSGVAGLACIRPVRDLGDVTLVRPLLDVRKAALVALVADAGLAAVDDPSNRDPRFDRTQARRWLAAAPGLSPDRLAEAAAHLAATEAALDWAAERAWQGRARCDADGVTLEAEGLPDEIVRRLVCRAIATLAPDARPRGPDVARLMQRLAGNSGGTLAGVRARPGQGWRFSLAPPRRRG